MVAKIMLAIASLHADENEVHDWVVVFWPVSIAFDHPKMEELVYIHQPRDTCPPGHCWKLHISIHV